MTACEVGPVRMDEVSAVVRLHYEVFGRAEHGYSLARLGPEFLETAFYRPNLGNPSFFCDVARYQGEVIGFNVYATDRRRTLSRTVRAQPVAVARSLGRLLRRRPVGALAFAIWNLPYLFGGLSRHVEDTAGWWMVMGLDPAIRLSEFKARTAFIAVRFVEAMEQRMIEHGCRAWFGLTPLTNHRMIRMLERLVGARESGRGREQGVVMACFVKGLPEGRREATSPTG